MVRGGIAARTNLGMYAVIGLPRLLTAYATSAGMVTFAILIFDTLCLHKTPSGFGWVGEIWGGIGKGMSVAAFLFGLGETAIFPWVCRLRLISRWIPDINGRWTGSLDSNWAQISARISGENPAAAKPTQAVPINVTIKARLFSVSMTLESVSQYSYSETVTVSVLKHGAADTLRLAYIYENHTPQPEPTDSGHHFGAAYLDLFGRGNLQSLEGNYWTNRNWTKGLNTAGRIVLQRKCDHPVAAKS
jgi:hypothetical protein